MWENGATYLKATANGTVDPAKAFYDATADWGVDAKISGSGNMGSAGYTADLDGDGDLDFVTNLWSNTTTFKVYRNDSNLRQANWLKVELIGAVSPAQGTGARVEVELNNATAARPAGQGSWTVRFCFGPGSAGLESTDLGDVPPLVPQKPLFS
jgi:hypothetical protein